MKRRGRVGLACAVVMAVCVATGCGPSAVHEQANDGKIVFAAVPSEESSGLSQDYQPVLDMLRDETGMTVEFQKATDYASIIEGQRAGKIDIAKYGPFSYVLAGNKGVSAHAVAGQVAERGQRPGYSAYAVTRTGSSITSLEQARGKRVCFVDPTSTSGSLYPKAALSRAGVDPERDIEPVFAGGHDAAALSVAEGDCDIGFAHDAMVDEQLPRSGEVDPGQLRTVWESPNIPGDPAAINDDLDPRVRELITNALRTKANSAYLRENGYCSGACEIGDTGGFGFAAVDDAFYRGVREVCAITGDQQCR